MILDYYGLREQPFGATPDSRYLFQSETHREALGSILYGIEQGRGFIGLIAKPGMGKTTLLFRGLSQLREKGRTVFLFQTISTPLDFLRTLLADLGVQDLQGSFFELQSKLNEILLEQARRGERLVVVIDETQNLDDSVLELVRMLSNFETGQEKLMQIVLSGQPQLARKLASPSLVQLRQRISIIAHLRAFSAEETSEYVDHRLRTAGFSSDRALFSPAALRLIAEHSEGIPRNINNLCFNALSLGCATKRRTIDADTIREVIADLDLDPLMDVPEAPSQLHARQTTAGRIGFSPRTWTWVPKAALATAVLLALSGATMQGDIKVHVFADAGRPHKLSPVQTNPPRSSLLAEVKPVDTIAASDADLPLNPVAGRPTAAKTSTDDLMLSPDVDRPPAAKASTDPPTEDARLDPGNRILVPPGVTLYQICSETLKSCHSKELNEIHRLNPWLTNPNHLESGRKLRMPSPQQLTGSAPEPISSFPAGSPR
jgi:general secretion pathway protein A